MRRARPRRPPAPLRSTAIPIVRAENWDWRRAARGLPRRLTASPTRVRATPIHPRLDPRASAALARPRDGQPRRRSTADPAPPACSRKARPPPLPRRTPVPLSRPRRRRPPAPYFRPQDEFRSADELFETRRGAVATNSWRWSDWLGRSACPAASLAYSLRVSSAAPTRAMMALASVRNAWPASVSSMRRPTRSKSFVSWRASSAAIAWLAADCARFSAWAARVTCWRSATAMKMRSCSRVISISFAIRLGKGPSDHPSSGISASPQLI